ncbi:hypothetical protein [Flavobacterium sp. GT3R68]|uniref:hypothetical protein n=1 Tax=Flavobacterium sp. GT3R68 TaxID=2594437 RepID=UPI000F85EFA0|nr:hypothetical protein [Flavobacterium sp. GT3R68]RTY95355.1 hypothetical protein EKL32_07955 [Flavobacterium sp. GSN2]TRW90905.1 hypothetical protein FNW07_08715 [Flavobacterium sp. GT3R68]
MSTKNIFFVTKHPLVGLRVITFFIFENKSSAHGLNRPWRINHQTNIKELSHEKNQFPGYGNSISISIQSQSNNYLLDFTKHNQNSIHVIANLDLTASKNKIFMITYGSISKI